MGNITVNRSTEAELKQAIADLEERGFEVVKVFNSSREHKTFDFRDGAFNKNRYTGSYSSQKHSAVMRRVEEVRLL